MVSVVERDTVEKRVLEMEYSIHDIKDEISLLLTPSLSNSVNGF